MASTHPTIRLKATRCIALGNENTSASRMVAQLARPNDERARPLTAERDETQQDPLPLLGRNRDRLSLGRVPAAVDPGLQNRVRRKGGDGQGHLAAPAV